MGAARLDVMQRVGKGGGLLRKKGGQQRRNREGSLTAWGGVPERGGLREKKSGVRRRKEAPLGMVFYVLYLLSPHYPFFVHHLLLLDRFLLVFEHE